VLASRQPAAIAVEAVGIQVVGFEVSIHRLASWAGGSTAWRRLDDDQRRLFFLGYFGGCQPGFL
jgi:hypothetical protein